MADIVFPGATPGSTFNSDALPTNADLVIYKGDFVRFNVTLPAGFPSLTSATVKAQLKTDYNDRDPKAFTCTITNPTTGVIEVYMPSSITTNILPGSYIWDLQVTFVTTDVRTYFAGDVTVINEVTT